MEVRVKADFQLCKINIKPRRITHYSDSAGFTIQVCPSWINWIWNAVCIATLGLLASKSIWQ